MAKGRPIHLEGRLKLDQWETQQGEKRSKLGVILESFEFVGTRADGERESSSENDGGTTYENTSPPPRVTQPTAATTNASTTPVDDIDEDVPF